MFQNVEENNVMFMNVEHNQFDDNDEEEQELINDNDENHAQLSEQRKKQKRIKIVYTCALYYCFIACGLCFSIFNPTLIELGEIFGTNLEQVSVIFPVRALGCTVGTLTNAFLTKYLNRQILLVSFLILKSLTTFLVPQWYSIRQFYFNGFFNGFFTAAIVVMVNVWLNELWSWSAIRRQQRIEIKNRIVRERLLAINREIHTDTDVLPNQMSTINNEITSNTINMGNVLMQALHFFYGFGCILGPILAEPYLRHPFIEKRDRFLSNCLVEPYTISAGVALSVAFVFFFLYLFYPYQQPVEDDSQEQLSVVNLLLESYDERLSRVPIISPSMQLVVIGFSCLFVFVFTSSEGTYFQFSASFLTKTKLHLSQPEAAMIASILAISFTAFRAFSVLLALKLTPGKMILFDLLAVGGGNFLVYWYADTDLTKLKLGFVLLGVGFSSLFPSFFPYLEHYGFTVTDCIGSLITFFSGLSEMLSPFVIGIYIGTNPFVLVYFTFASVACSLLALFMLHFCIKLSIR